MGYVRASTHGCPRASELERASPGVQTRSPAAILLPASAPSGNSLVEGTRETGSPPGPCLAKKECAYGGCGREAIAVRAFAAVTARALMARTFAAVAGSRTTHANSNVADVSAAVARSAI